MPEKQEQEKLDSRIKHFLDKFSKKEYSETDIKNAEDKAYSKYKDKLGEIWDKVRLLFEVAKHPLLWGAQYAVMATLAVIYLVSPVDAVPDFIPVGGLADDIAVIGFIIATIIKGIYSFTIEKKLKLRSCIPEDLCPLFDKLAGIRQADIKNYTDLEKEKEAIYETPYEQTDVLYVKPENKEKQPREKCHKPKTNKNFINTQKDIDDERKKVEKEISTFDSQLDERKKKRIFAFAEKKGQVNDKNIDEVRSNLDSKKKGPLAAIWDKVMALWNYFNTNCSLSDKAIIIGALLYVVTPVDIIPDIVPVIGLVDDAFLIASVYSMFLPVLKKPIVSTVKQVSQTVEKAIDPVIEWEVSQLLDRVYYKKLAWSLINLVLFMFGVLLISFPIFGTLASSIISSLLLLFSLGMAIFRFVTLMRKPYTIPLLKSVWRMKNVKTGITEYIRSCDFKLSRFFIFGEKLIDGFFKLLGIPVNEKFLDRFADHCWQLIKKDVIRFVLYIICIFVSFFIVRHALLSQFTDLSFWQIILHPFIVVIDTMKW